MTIVREPGTRLPKIPGTTLSGASRSYSALLYGKPEAAGQQKGFRGDRTKCPILHTYGSATDDDKGNAGTISICDAHILLFPVATSQGPMWVTTGNLLTAAGFKQHTLVPGSDAEIKTTEAFNAGARLNLGWVLFESPMQGALGEAAANTIASTLLASPASDKAAIDAILNRIVVVHENIFPAIVNSNLEVRTSVVIKPETGTADPGRLFSYEAIPRATVLMGDVIEDDYRITAFAPVTKQFNPGGGLGGSDEENAGKPLMLNSTWTRPAHVVKAGMDLMENLGVGGMGTRGFGRLRAICPAMDPPTEVGRKEASHDQP
jgi:CRISPR-associated protein Cmr4